VHDRSQLGLGEKSDERAFSAHRPWSASPQQRPFEARRNDKAASGFATTLH
jgi:hypothetical protein